MNTKSIIIFVLVTVGILAGAVGLLWKFSNPQEKVIEDAAGEERHVQGEGAVTVVEFSDLQCPACKAVQDPLKQVLSKYQGKVKLIYRHFPLTNIHKNAMVAAQASEAAHLQGKFWEMHDVLFAKQAEWQGESDPAVKFAQYAKDLGLDEQKFTADLNAQEVKDPVTADTLAATRYRLSGTPTFLVNGVLTEFNNLDTVFSELTK